MTALDRDRLLLVSPYIDEALDLAPTEQLRWIAELRTRNAAIAADVEALLVEHTTLQRDRFLERRPDAPPVAGSLAGLVVGAYTLRAPLGQGGMGTVWLADRSDGRFEGAVAVKLLNPSLLGTAGEARFRHEASLLARLSHPHIARLVDAGLTPFGHPYLVLEYVDGERIDHLCASRALALPARIALFLDVLGAVAHAHANLIVHRDLKPPNVLVDRAGRVKLLDFGIAQIVEEDAEGDARSGARGGERAMTPGYAAPEQLLGGHVTTATDVYALGVLLYVLVTGQHPTLTGDRSAADAAWARFDDEAPLASRVVVDTRRCGTADLDTHAAALQVTPRRLRSLLEGDLDAIVAKALARDPRDRYASAEAMARDLSRHLAHRPIEARRCSLAGRSARFARRHRTAVALSALAALSVLGGVGGTVTQARRADREARVASAQRDFALRQLARAEAINDLNGFVLLDAAANGRPFTADELLARAERIVDRQPDDGDDVRVDALIAIGRYHMVQDEDERARQVLAKAYALAGRRPGSDSHVMAGCVLASAVADTGDLTRADALLREAEAALPGTSPYGLHRVFCLFRGSEVARARGDGPEAVRRIEEARGLLRASPVASSALDVSAAIDLAESYRVSGRDREAAAAFAEAFARLSALGRDDTEMAGTLLNNWATAVEALGRPLEAEALLRRAVRISSRDGTERGVSPMLLNNLARVLRDLGRLEPAQGLADRAYERARRDGHRVVQHQSLAVRASVYRQRGDRARAAKTLRALESSARADLPPDHILFARIASERALVAHAGGDHASARAESDRAIAIAEASPLRESYLPELLLDRARVRLGDGRAEDAHADATRALAMMVAQADASVPSSRIGLAQLAIGQALLARGARDDARQALASASLHLARTLGEAHLDARRARDLGATPATSSLR